MPLSKQRNPGHAPVTFLLVLTHGCFLDAEPIRLAPEGLQGGKKRLPFRLSGTKRSRGPENGVGIRKSVTAAGLYVVTSIVLLTDTTAVVILFIMFSI